MSTLEIKRVLPAARPDVFREFSTADQLARWWGPKGFSVDRRSWHVLVFRRMAWSPCDDSDRVAVRTRA